MDNIQNVVLSNRKPISLEEYIKKCNVVTEGRQNGGEMVSDLEHNPLAHVMVEMTDSAIKKGLAQEVVLAMRESIKSFQCIGKFVSFEERLENMHSIEAGEFLHDIEEAKKTK